MSETREQNMEHAPDCDGRYPMGHCHTPCPRAAGHPILAPASTGSEGAPHGTCKTCGRPLVHPTAPSFGDDPDRFCSSNHGAHERCLAWLSDRLAAEVTRLTACDDSARHYTAALDRVQAREREAQALLLDARAEVADLRGKLEAARERIAHLEGTVDEQRTLLDGVAASDEGYQRAIDAAIAERDTARAERDAAREQLDAIHDRAHDLSTGPAVPDGYWEIREMATMVGQ